MAQAVTTSREASGDNIANAVREAGYAALIAFGLFVLLIGLKTDQNIRNELILVPRWGLLAIIVALTAAGRFVTVAYIHPALARGDVRRIWLSAIASAAALLVAFLIAFPPDFRALLNLDWKSWLFILV